MSKVFVGNITSNSERLLNEYLSKFMPDAVVEPLKVAGIITRIKNHAVKPDVVLVILDEALYNKCSGVADNVLSLPKVHKYVSEDGFQEFLVSKFGVLNPTTEVKEEEVVEVKPSVEEIKDDEDFNNLTVTDSEDTSSDKDSIIQKLNDELIIKDTMIRNLEAQVEEKSSSADVSHFVSRIKSLESELENTKSELSKVQNDLYANSGKIEKAEEVLASIDELKEKLKEEKDKFLKLESEKSDLESKLNQKEEELQTLNQSVNDLNSTSDEVVELQETIKTLQSNYDAKVSELQEVLNKNKDLEKKVTDLNSKVAELELLNDKVNSLAEENKSLSSKNSELKSVKVDLENLKVDYNKLLSERDSLSNKAKELTEKLNSSSSSMDSALLDKENLEKGMQDLSSNNDALSKQLNEVNKELVAKNKEIDELNRKLSEYEGVLSELEDSKNKVNELSIELKKFEDVKSSLSDKINEVETLQEELSNKSLMEETISNKDAEIEGLKNELNTVIEERNSKSSLLEEKDSSISSLTNEISSLKDEMSNLSNQVSELESEKENLDTENQKLRNEVEALQENSQNSDVIIQASSELEEELLDCKKNVARLQVENESLKEELENSKNMFDKDAELVKLRSEVDTYKDKVKQLKEDNNTSANELANLRTRYANLEVSVIEKEDKLKETENSIFSLMGSIASPKTVFNLSLDVPKELPNMYVIASGSSESNLVTYQTLKRFCSSIDKSVLILDLVTDSYIDREFGVEKILSPIEFLQGEKPISDFVSRAKVGNTLVSSTAFSYLNSLYLLNVNWQTVLVNLCGVADIVIVNVGCLNEIVSKVLFNAFSSVMQSHIIIKASPINLRTALLTLTGIPSAKTSKISCVNFENSSKGMYQRLAQKFNTQILKDSDVLKL